VAVLRELKQGLIGREEHYGLRSMEILAVMLWNDCFGQMSYAVHDKNSVRIYNYVLVHHVMIEMVFVRWKQS